MLFRRFALVAASIAVLGVMLSNIIEATQTSNRGFEVDQRLNEWRVRDAQRACQHDAKLCVDLTVVKLAI